MIRFPFIAALAVTALAAPAAAQDFGAAAAEGRLRGCLLAGSTSALEGDLRIKVTEVRAFCGAQIARVRDQRTAGLSGDARAAAVRKLDAEIAQSIAQFTGKDANALDS
jgi:hypothetical protein